MQEKKKKKKMLSMIHIIICIVSNFLFFRPWASVWKFYLCNAIDCTDEPTQRDNAADNKTLMQHHQRCCQVTILLLKEMSKVT